MFLNFASLARLPIVDATAISFTSPLITVALSAIFLKEKVRFYRWSAVIVGFIGVVVMLWQQFDISRYANAGDCRDLGRGGRRDLRARRRDLQCRRGDPDAAADRERDHVLDRVLFLADLRAGGPCHLAIRLDDAGRRCSLRR